MQIGARCCINLSIFDYHFNLNLFEGDLEQNIYIETQSAIVRVMITVTNDGHGGG